jgi:hypothetical protein
MDKDKKSFDGILGKLALISEGLDQLYTGNKTVVFEVSKDDFNSTINELTNVIGNEDKMFKIVISNIEFIFVLNE